MVDTILSDKTGTLTRNIMEFFKCSIGGTAYGRGITEIEKSNARRMGTDPAKLVVDQDPEAAVWRQPAFNFYDHRCTKLLNPPSSSSPNPPLNCCASFAHPRNILDVGDSLALFVGCLACSGLHLGRSLPVSACSCKPVSNCSTHGTSGTMLVGGLSCLHL